MILVFSHVGSNLGIFKKLAESSTPLSGSSLAESAEADPVLISMFNCPSISSIFNRALHRPHSTLLSLE